MKQKTSVAEKLLIVLFKSNATTGVLAEKLGYIKGKKRLYKYVDTDLKNLESKGYIRRKKIPTGSPGRPAIECSIVYDIPILVKMLDEYPHLLHVLQVNEKVLNILLEKHHPLLLSRKNNSAYPIDYLEEQFKTELRKSSHFFELCLNTDTEDLIERASYVLSVSPDVEQVRKIVTGEGIIAIGTRLPINDFIFDIIYKSCLTMDFLSGTIKIQNLHQVTEHGEKIVYNQLIKISK